MCRNEKVNNVLNCTKFVLKMALFEGFIYFESCWCKFLGKGYNAFTLKSDKQIKFYFKIKCLFVFNIFGMGFALISRIKFVSRTCGVHHVTLEQSEHGE